MAERHLVLTCSLSGSRDCAGVQALLKQYGLDSYDLGTEIVARGDVPSMLTRMRDIDIEAHLTQRIEDAVPGTRVATIKATLVTSLVIEGQSEGSRRN